MSSSTRMPQRGFIILGVYILQCQILKSCVVQAVSSFQGVGSCIKNRLTKDVKYASVDDIQNLQLRKSQVLSTYSDIGIPYLVIDQLGQRHKVERFLQCLQDESANGALCYTETNDEIEMDGIRMREKEDIVVKHRHKQVSSRERSLELDLKAPLRHDAYFGSGQMDKLKNILDIISVESEAVRIHTRQSHSDPNTITATVEILVWTDFSFFKSFQDLEQGRKEVEKDILRYIATLINAADLRMKKGLSRDPSINVSLVLSGVVICKTSDCSWFIDNYKVNNTIDNHVALDHFAEALKNDYQTKFSFRYDYAAVLTRLDVTDPSGYPIGVAFADDICQVNVGKSSAVIEDQGAFSSVGTFVHELAHTLGSDHDGWFRSTNCSSADGYIMSTLSPLTKNGFYFSNCSIASMKENLRQPNASCVFDNPVPYGVKRNLTDILPGQIYNMSQQCSQIYGTTFCLSVGTKMEDICYKMYCWDPFLQGVCSTKSPAALGTSCGPQKWCIGGECVYDQRAPNIQNVIVG